MTTFLMGHTGQSSLGVTSVVLPTVTGDYESDAESDYGDSPLSQEELRAKVQRSITRREQTRKLAQSVDSSHPSPSHPPPSTALPGKTRGGGTTDRKKRPIQTR
ncbi:hypothetical protein GBAR_LOCUS15827 [Geodia barretti]|uniref:Uncharacterized protein n=1 Tax=Geodia barretti TaxID=519541 RepID=A0AA35SFT0_GEOBA|nr:hypothetical protein GBAR_LOCUS15827 [Geodia barretti]